MQITTPAPTPTHVQIPTTDSYRFILLARLTAINALIERVYLTNTSMRLTIDRIFNDGVSRKEAIKDPSGVRHLFMCPPDMANAFVKGGMPYKDVIAELSGHLARFHAKMKDVTLQKVDLKNLWAKYDNIWSLYKACPDTGEITASDIHAFVKHYNLYLISYLKAAGKTSDVDTLYQSAMTERSAKMLRTLTTAERAALHAFTKGLPVTPDMEPLLDSLRSKLFIEGDTVSIHVPEGTGSKSYDALFGAKSASLSLFDQANPPVINAEEVEACLDALPQAPDSEIAKMHPHVLEILDFWCEFKKSVWAKVQAEHPDFRWNVNDPIVNISAPLWDHPTRAISVRRIFEDMGMLRVMSQVRGKNYVIEALPPFFSVQPTREDFVRYVRTLEPAQGSVYQEFLDVVLGKVKNANAAEILYASTLKAALRHRDVTGVYELDNLRVVAMIRGDLRVESTNLSGVYAYAPSSTYKAPALPDLSPQAPAQAPAQDTSPVVTHEETPMPSPAESSKTLLEKTLERPKQVLIDPTLNEMRENTVFAILSLLNRQSGLPVPFTTLEENTAALLGGETLMNVLQRLFTSQRVSLMIPQLPPTWGKDTVTVSVPVNQLSFIPR